MPSRFQRGDRLLRLIESAARIGHQSHPATTVQPSAEATTFSMLEADDLGPTQSTGQAGRSSDDPPLIPFDRGLRGLHRGDDHQHADNYPSDHTTGVLDVENREHQCEYRSDREADGHRPSLRIQQHAFYLLVFHDFIHYVVGQRRWVARRRSMSVAVRSESALILRRVHSRRSVRHWFLGSRRSDGRPWYVQRSGLRLSITLLIIWTVLGANEIIQLIVTEHPSVLGTVWRATTSALYLFVWTAAVASTVWLIKHRNPTTTQ